VGTFALAVAAGDLGAMLAVLGGLVLVLAVAYAGTLGFFDMLGFLGSWAGKVAGWPLLLFQIGLAVAAGLILLFAPGGLIASGCL